MKCLALLVLTSVCAHASPAAAKDPGQEAYMSRVLACKGTDAKMEVYVPQSTMRRLSGQSSATTRLTFRRRTKASHSNL
jgi:hypothetical protein